MDKKTSSNNCKICKKLIWALNETLWMAQRYADGRRTYAPHVFNHCIEELRKLNLENLNLVNIEKAKDPNFDE